MARTTRITGDKAVDFKRMAGDRTSVALVALKRLAKTGNRSAYAPDAASVKSIMDALQAALIDVEVALTNGYKGDTGGFKL